MTRDTSRQEDVWRNARDDEEIIDVVRQTVNELETLTRRLNLFVNGDEIGSQGDQKY